MDESLGPQVTTSSASDTHNTKPVIQEDSPASLIIFDIEHVPVTNDPRAWTATRKNVILTIIAAASMIAGLAGNIQNPSIQEMEEQLPASSSEISLSISLFILLQGTVPLIWSAISEIKGRRLVYLVSIAIFAVGSIVVATSNSIGLVIGFRCLQGAGSSAVISIGAATLADIFDPAERGTKMGIYYMAPLLGPSLGPILGGVLTTGFDWRAPFWFLAIFAGVNLLSFLLLFKDTFRRERSLTYQNVLRQRIKEQIEQSKSAISTTVQDGRGHLSDLQPAIDEQSGGSEKDVEARLPVVNELLQATLPTIKLSFKDVNPFKPVWLVLRRWNNVIILLASGFLYAFSFVIAYTTSRTLGSAYQYNPLKIGLVLLSYGLGSIAGSILGGRWSDRSLARLKATNGGQSLPEMRLRSTILGVWLLPPSVLGFAWVSQQHVHVSAICIMLFLCGFFSIWIYSSTLAYIVDANNGRSSTAVASNSAFRGLASFIGTEIAVPLQDAVGDGWMYTIWAVLMLITGILILLVMWKGGQWREAAEIREAQIQKENQ